LAEEELLASRPRAPLVWDIDRIGAKDYTDNVVESRGPETEAIALTTQDALKPPSLPGQHAEIARQHRVPAIRSDGGRSEEASALVLCPSG